MSQQSFAILAENSIRSLLQRLEDNAALADAEIDLIDGVLHVQLEDGSHFIVNSQSSAEQLWLATPFGPHHFSYDASSQVWRDDRSGEPLDTLLEQALSRKLGMPVKL